MTLQATTLAFDSAPPSRLAKLVFIALSDEVNERGVALLTDARLARAATFALATEDETLTAIDVLRHHGFLTLDRAVGVGATLCIMGAA